MHASVVTQLGELVIAPCIMKAQTEILEKKKMFELYVFVSETHE